VFNYFFESRNSKERSYIEMRDLFHDKTEEIINYLWNLADKIYNNPQPSTNSNDLLDEIYKDKNDNKKFPSQIVNPNANASTSATNESGKVNKNLFGSAIEKVRDEKRRDTRDPRDTRDTRDPRDSRDPRDNRDTREYSDSRDAPRDHRDRVSRDRRDLDLGRRQYDYGRDREDRRRGRNKYDNPRTMQIGGKKLVLKDKGRSRSRERDREGKEKERPRDEKSPDEEEEEMREREYEKEGGYQKNYYPVDRYRERVPYYQQRGYQRGRGRFTTGRFMRGQRFMDTRR
jgi:hypothetical protein